jgi:hypothetical protein
VSEGGPLCSIEVVLEVARKRAFASAIDWPGWCRPGRDAALALHVLADYGSRYRSAVGSRGRALPARLDPSSLQAVERLKGNATTDFGAPGAIAQVDEREVDGREARRLLSLLKVCWDAFDRAAAAAEGNSLRTGPRGGGRSLRAIVRHVHEAEGAYLGKIGGPTKTPPADDELRDLVLGILWSRATGDPPPRVPRSGTVWPVRYAIRRSAWHALDHAWEIEDRAES